ncbi:hypothetical protein [Paraburkholderia sp. BCC1886]|uniref:hypothetical protein n=1 Tax=Paraburkholderia sp. BCC1886 TaxID=2562670 RepID=UPI001181E139|nr:hypothetical protein [Paraburkholderia sp. BCC1886]
MAELLIRIHTHHFSVSRVTPRGRPAVTAFARQFVAPLTRKPSPYAKKPQKAPPVFATYCDNTGEYRFHINTLRQFQEELGYYQLKGSLVEVEHVPVPEPVRVELPISKMWTEERELYDYQEKGIEYVMQPFPVSKLIDFQTGKGKGVTSLIGVSRLGLRPCIMVAPKYLDKWRDEIREVYDIAIEDLMMIRKGVHLRALLEMGVEDLITSKIILISSELIADWMKFFKMRGDESLDLGYACRPQELLGTLGAGIRLIDEVHEEFHRHFLIDLHTHCERSLSLSATLTKEDLFIKRMQEIAYPKKDQHLGPAYDKYAAVTALFYRFNDPELIKCEDRMTGFYSHNLFEQSIINYPDMLQGYMELINDVMKQKYLKKYLPGDKCIIFCASVDLCTRLVAWLKEVYPEKDVRRYVEEDPFENVIEADIRVTTIISAGTAIDIPQLTLNIMTTAVSSVVANLQCFGRLRKMKDGRTPEWVYFVNEDQPKHMTYHERKIELMRTRALTFGTQTVHARI